MIKALKLMIIGLLILGIALSILNFVSVDNMAAPPVGGKPEEPGDAIGTLQGDGSCEGEPLNC